MTASGSIRPSSVHVQHDVDVHFVHASPFAVTPSSNSVAMVLSNARSKIASEQTMENRKDWRVTDLRKTSGCVICIDLKSFYASVECADRGLDPFTTNLVVADPARSANTICLAITPALKARGVKNRCRLGDIPDGIEFTCAMPRMKPLHGGIRQHCRRLSTLRFPRRHARVLNRRVASSTPRPTCSLYRHRRAHRSQGALMRRGLRAFRMSPPRRASARIILHGEGGARRVRQTCSATASA